MTLSITQVKCAKAGDRDYKLSDSRGLYLLVKTTGTKSWRFKYRYGSQEKLLTIGRYPDVGLAAARDLADNARRLLREGKDRGCQGSSETYTSWQPLAAM